MSAVEAAAAIKRGVLNVLPGSETIPIPMADGGEGTVNALVASTHGKFVTVDVTGPLDDPVRATYGILGDGVTAVIEMAAASGLTLIPENRRNPLLTTTYGTGQLIKHALDNGCRKFIIGIGGSATNDGGTGMAQALGVRFTDQSGTSIRSLMCGETLRQVQRIDFSNLHSTIKNCTFTAACDVDNPLLGEHGCASVYAPQKGASPAVVEKLESGMRQFADVLEDTIKRTVRTIPGAGAAGGLGAGLVAFLNATLKPGIELVLAASQFDQRIQQACLVITGEGKLDRQTAFGKTIAGIVRSCQKQNVPVIAFAGIVEPCNELDQLGLKHYFSIRPENISVKEAMETGPELLQHAVERAIRNYSFLK
ncbi:glycerate kinase [candidate division KSB1 bacterium]|nr:glycerate kinase [candidate division KSB1 bacterium]